ncbi:unnamed protein product, partial [Iphiclides podalirius]
MFLLCDSPLCGYCLLCFFERAGSFVQQQKLRGYTISLGPILVTDAHQHGGRRPLGIGECSTKQFNSKDPAISSSLRWKQKTTQEL